MKGIVRIEIQGHLDERWTEWFEGMSIRLEGSKTILTGEIQDEANLHGILDQIKNLNLKLISVNPLNDSK